MPGVGSLYFCCRLTLYVGHSENSYDLGPDSSLPPGQSLKGLTGCPLVDLPRAGTNHSLKEDLGNYGCQFNRTVQRSGSSRVDVRPATFHHLRPC